MIRFLLDDEEIALTDTPPDLTVLDWLRLYRHRTGTKEGCGSGDCGACTVVVVSRAVGDATSDVTGNVTGDANGDVTGEVRGEVTGEVTEKAAPLSKRLSRSPVVAEAINSCITFIGALHGKQLLTIESLSKGGGLHPVQQAMVEQHGSQCGFCTPGFVMSMYALYRSELAPETRWLPTVPSLDPVSSASRPDSDDPGKPAISETSLADQSAASNHVANTPNPDQTQPWLSGIDTPDAAALAERVDRTLGGNLCRCTGYRPIKRAMVVSLAQRSMMNAMPVGEDTALQQLNADDQLAERLAKLATSPVEHDGFHVPQSVDELASLLLEYPDARLLGGGTDLALEVTRQMKTVQRLVLTRSVPELLEIQCDGAQLSIGSAVSLTRCLDVMAPVIPYSAELLGRFGSDQVRNQGTLGGNIGSASPIGDLLPMLLALGAAVLLQRGDVRRVVPLNDYFLDYRKTVLQQSEFVRTVQIPLPADEALFAVHKVSKRMDDDISAVCGAFHIEFDDARDTSSGVRRVSRACVAFGGMAATPRRALAVEQALCDQPFDQSAIQAAQQAMAIDFLPMSDARASAGYRLQVAQNLLQRVWLAATDVAVATRIGDISIGEESDGGINVGTNNAESQSSSARSDGGAGGRDHGH